MVLNYSTCENTVSFKFNPCAVPFIPSISKERASMVVTNMNVRRMDAGDSAFWNHEDTVLDGYGKIPEMEDELYFNCLPRHMFDSTENEMMSEKQTLNVESELEERISSWLQNEDIFVHSQGGSSVCDESWSATPVSSASPPLNDDLDHNSTSYGSLPTNSFTSDLTQSEFPKEQSSDEKLDQLDMDDPSCNVMRYYSPFGTGVSTWLAGEKNTRKESSRSLKDIGGKFQEEMQKDLLKTGNIWNDVDPSKTISSWMRQISMDNSEDDDLFSVEHLKDEISGRMQPPFSRLNNSEKRIKPSPELVWAGQLAEQRRLSAAMNSQDALLSISLEPNQNYVSYSGKNKLGPMGKGQFIETSRLDHNSRSHHMMPRHQHNVPFLDTDGVMMVPEPMVCLPQFGPEVMNYSAFPVFYVSSSVPFHPNAKHRSMYNPYVMHLTPQFPGFMNLPQFYPNIDPQAMNGLGMKNSAYFSLNRHSAPALELHQQLDMCYEQFRQLENERKKTEAEMARQHPGKEITSDNTLTVPLMPPNPSRIDRLVVEILREHARVVTLVSRMAQLRKVEFQAMLLVAFEYWMEGAQKLQTCRKNEIINRKKYRLDIRGVAQKEKDMAALASALADLAVSTRKARTALWCALQLSSVDLPQRCLKLANAVAKQSEPGNGLDSKFDAGLDFGYNGRCDFSEEGVGFVDYQCEFYNDSDHDDCEDELNQEVFSDENVEDLDCEVFECSLPQEPDGRESDNESYAAFNSSIDDKAILDTSLYDDQFQLEAMEKFCFESENDVDSSVINSSYEV